MHFSACKGSPVPVKSKNVLISFWNTFAFSISGTTEVSCILSAILQLQQAHTMTHMTLANWFFKEVFLCRFSFQTVVLLIVMHIWRLFFTFLCLILVFSEHFFCFFPEPVTCGGIMYVGTLPRFSVALYMQTLFWVDTPHFTSSILAIPIIRWLFYNFAMRFSQWCFPEFWYWSWDSTCFYIHGIMPSRKCCVLETDSFTRWFIPVFLQRFYNILLTYKVVSFQAFVHRQEHPHIHEG